MKINFISPLDGAEIYPSTIYTMMVEVVAEAGETLPKTVSWTVSDSSAATLGSRTSAVSVSHSGKQVAATTINVSGQSPVTVTASSATPAATASATYTPVNLSFIEGLSIGDFHAQVTPPRAPVPKPGDPSLILFYVKVMKDGGKPANLHPISLSFVPDINLIFFKPGQPLQPVTFERDEDIKAYLLSTDSQGVCELYIACAETAIFEFTGSAATATLRRKCAFVNPLTAGRYSPAIGVSDIITIPEGEPYFTLWVPGNVSREVEPPAAEVDANTPPSVDASAAEKPALMWVVGKNREVSYSQITTLDVVQDLANGGARFRYDSLDNSGALMNGIGANTIGYAFQRGLNGATSQLFSLSASGVAMVVPDPNVERALLAPTLNYTTINMDAVDAGVNLTIPKLSATALVNVDGSVYVQPMLYINGWDENDKRRCNLVKLPAKELKAPFDQEVVVTIPKDDLIGYASKPGPDLVVATLRADYQLTVDTLIRGHSMVLGDDTHIPIETVYKT